MEASLLNRFHPLVSTRLACLTHPIGAAVMGIFGGALVQFGKLRRRHGKIDANGPNADIKL